MRNPRRLVLIALSLYFVLLVPALCLSASTWSNVIPTDGAKGIGTIPLTLGATVTWGISDAPFNAGTITVVASGFNGSTSVFWKCTITTTDGGGTVTFGPPDRTPPIINAYAEFSPAVLSGGTSVTVTYTATGNTSGGNTSSSQSTTFTSS